MSHNYSHSLDPNAQVWTASPKLDLAFIASELSGHPLVVRLRDQLRQSLSGDGLLLAERSGDPIVVVHHGVRGAPPPTFDFIYVGIGYRFLQPTPWSSPFVGPEATRYNCFNYVSNRADRKHMAGTTARHMLLLHIPACQS